MKAFFGISGYFQVRLLMRTFFCTKHPRPDGSGTLENWWKCHSRLGMLFKLETGGRRMESGGGGRPAGGRGAPPPKMVRPDYIASRSSYFVNRESELVKERGKNIFWPYRSCKFLPGRELGVFVGQHRKNLPVFCHFVVDKYRKVAYI